MKSNHESASTYATNRSPGAAADGAIAEFLLDAYE
jgi:hypothetical protein